MQSYKKKDRVDKQSLEGQQESLRIKQKARQMVCQRLVSEGKKAWGGLLTIVRQTSKDVIVKVDIFLGRFIIHTTFSMHTEQLVQGLPRLHPKINGITSSRDTSPSAG